MTLIIMLLNTLILIYVLFKSLFLNSNYVILNRLSFIQKKKSPYLSKGILYMINIYKDPLSRCDNHLNINDLNDIYVSIIHFLKPNIVFFS